MRPLQVLPVFVVSLFGCTDAPVGPASNDSAGSGGSAAAPVAGSAGMSSGGASAEAGGSSVSGNSAGGAAGSAVAASGAGGMSGAIAGGGSNGGSGGNGGASPVVPSAGCGKSGRPPDGEVSVPQDRIYSFPTSYDGNTPMPAVIAMHGANNPNTILKDLSDGSRLEEKFVRVFPKSNETAWRYEGGTGADSMRLSDIYDELLATYCVDSSRIFLMGHSSGAQMATQMVCKAGGDARFKAVAPVAASKYCDVLTPVPVLYIQGAMDAQRNGSDGANVVAVFSASNGCMQASMPYAPIMGCNSDFDNKPVDPGCIEYQGCTKTTVWCRHNDNTYNLTDGHMHGWPCFASDAIADFFLSLP
jgi:poly(3-hydroxybutyrate) depolymerase